MQVEFKVFYFNPIRECTWLVWDEGMHCAIIDPGCAADREFDRLEQFVTEKGLKPEAIWLTHAHFDHILGLDAVRRRWNIPVWMHREEVQQLPMARRMAAWMDLQLEEPKGPFHLLEGGETLHLGKAVFQVIHTPGHTSGCVCYYNEASGLLFSGDTIFEGSIGRTDLPTGDPNAILDSVRTRLLCLPDSTQILPGHGYPTTIGREKVDNLFLRP